ncbi:MAG: 23S rRNA (guanosine(2251)-2'-O)-methyltransferase RlmB [Bryobacterales bacterium]|jgi:23S rRNA (guanosine2251-2'-O)-methyltransferase|nr:23S rRNA (guanosine(2251)-2'-O)-methyltransferase RlmB [Bryobacterales bacterium]
MMVRSGIHPVLEALRAGSPLDRVMVARGMGGPRIQEIIDACRAAKVPVRFEPREALDRLAKGSVHQGVVAVGAERAYQSLADVTGREMLVLLDGVEDPHNLGAIVRSAHAAGAGAVVLPERRAAGITDTVTKSAAGALEYLPLVRVKNLANAMEELKQAGYWIYGLDERGTVAHWDVPWQSPSAIVLGAEGHGLHRLVRDGCDYLLRIPMAGEVASLNVSVAAGVVLFEWRRTLAAKRIP